MSVLPDLQGSSCSRIYWVEKCQFCQIYKVAAVVESTSRAPWKRPTHSRESACARMLRRISKTWLPFKNFNLDAYKQYLHKVKSSAYLPTCHHFSLPISSWLSSSSSSSYSPFSLPTSSSSSSKMQTSSPDRWTRLFPPRSDDQSKSHFWVVFNSSVSSSLPYRWLSSMSSSWWMWSQPSWIDFFGVFYIQKFH